MNGSMAMPAIVTPSDSGSRLKKVLADKMKKKKNSKAPKSSKGAVLQNLKGLDAHQR